MFEGDDMMCGRPDTICALLSGASVSRARLQRALLRVGAWTFTLSVISRERNRGDEGWGIL